MNDSIWPKPKNQISRRSDSGRSQAPDLVDFLNHLDLMTQAVASLRALDDKARAARKDMEQSTEELSRAAKATVEEPMRVLSGQIAALKSAAETGASTADKTQTLLTEVNGIVDALKSSLDKMVTQLTETLKASTAAMKDVRRGSPGPEPAKEKPWTRLQLVVTGRDYQERIETVELVKIA